MKTKRVISIVCALVTVFMTSCGDGPMAKFYGKDSFVGRLFDTVKGWFMGEEPIKSYIENVAGLDMRMVCVDGGTFQMGATPEQVRDSEADESPVHTITLSTFYIGATEVTQAQWEAIMGTTIYEQRDKSGKKAILGVGPDYPMYYVSWEEAVEFCKRLSERTGKCYVLPTEAQWEFAARGGNLSKGYRFSGGMSADSVAWHSGNSDGEIHPVAQKVHNELTLYDMSGNVYEWCRDWHTEYSYRSVTDPVGPMAGRKKVLRGGSYRYGDRYCRIANRGTDFKAERFTTDGFRVVMIPTAEGETIELPVEDIQIYEVGDYYDDGNKQGVVFSVTDDGLHGKIVSLKHSSSPKKWASDRECWDYVGADEFYNGVVNATVVKMNSNWRKGYPAFAWCDNLGYEWYLPAICELEQLFSEKEKVNSRLKKVGGVELGKKKFYWSSTENSSGAAWYITTSNGTTGTDGKNVNDTYVRAIATF